MKSNFSRLLLLYFFFITVCLAHLARAQSKTGTTIGQVLLIEPSARATAMGNAGVALYDEVASVYYNPGAMGQLSEYGIHFTHSLWLADIKYDYAAAFIPAGSFGNLFFSLTALNSGEITVRTVAQPLGTGERYSFSNLALGLGYGRALSDRFSVGVQLTYLQETIWHSSLSTFALNVGTIYRLSENGLRLGASISNFGLQAGYDGRDLRIQYDLTPDVNGDNSALPGKVVTQDFSLPVLFRAGVSLPVKFNSRHQVLLAVDAFHPNDNTESMSVGAEWSFLNAFALRGGYQNLFLKDSEAGLTAGAGLHYDFQGFVFKFDYSWADYGRLENAQRFSLGLEF
jgi:hypothetical protein